MQNSTFMQVSVSVFDDDYNEDDVNKTKDCVIYAMAVA